MNARSTGLDFTGKRCLVTGGSGFIGSCLVARLIRLGASVGSLSRHASQQLSPSGAGAITFDCDLRNLDQTIECYARFKPDIVFHFAACPDGREDIDQATNVIDSNVGGTLHSLEAFRLCGGGVFVYGDSCKVFGNLAEPYRESSPLNPVSSYAISKAAGWNFCKLYEKVYGANVVSIRPTLIYGPGQSFNLISYVVQCARQGKEVVLDGGSQTRAPLFIDDAVEAIVAVGAKGSELTGRVVNIGGGVEYSIRQLATIILELMQLDLPIFENQASVRPTEMWRSYCDNKEAELLLGWSPVTDILTGLRRTIANLEEACVFNPLKM